MNEKLVRFLRCPICLGTLELTIYESGASERHISAGLLSCGCGAKYPIWRGVPRMLLPAGRRLPPDYRRAVQGSTSWGGSRIPDRSWRKEAS